MQELGQPGHFGRVDRPIIGAFGDTGNITAHPHHRRRLSLESRDHLLHALHSTGERNIRIGAAKAFGGGDEYANTLNRGRQCRLQTPHIRSQSIELRRTGRYPLHHLRPICHLWHPFRANETGAFDPHQAGARQSLRQRDFICRGDKSRFILKPITRTNLKNLNLLLHHASSCAASITAKTTPASTC